MQQEVTLDFGMDPGSHDETCNDSQASRRRSKLKTPIGLRTGSTHHRVVPLVNDLSQQKLKLPALVSAKRKSGQVITFEVYGQATQKRG
jgi:hypothetical protein